MKKILQTVLLGLSIIIGATSCQKEYHANPDAKNTGGDKQNVFRGTFTATVDGHNFVGEIKKTSMDVNKDNGVKTLSVTAIEYFPNRREDCYRMITVTVPNYDKNEAYPTPWASNITYVFSNMGNKDIFTTQTPSADYFVQIFSLYKGVFQSKLISQDQTRTIELTNGAFDISEP